MNPTHLKELKGTVKTATKTVKTATDAVSKAKATPKEIGKVFGKNDKGATGNKVKITNIIEEIDVGAPRRLVYDQWTRFQDFPSFTKKVENTDQVADEKLQWKAKIFWSTRTWESTIIEQVPDERVVWRSKGAKGYVDGAATFHELSPDLTRVLLVLEYHPKGLFEKTGNLWRAQGRRARLELKNFQRHVMTHALVAKADDVEGWRGEIRDSEVVKSHEDAVADEKKQRSGGRRSSGSTRSRKTSTTGRSSSRSSGTKRSAGTKSSSSDSSSDRRSSSDQDE